MKYILMHQDIQVAYCNEYKQLLNIINKNELPIGTQNDNSILQQRLFENWFYDRIIPNNRQNKLQIENTLGTSITDAYIKSLGVSLTDCYWFKPEDSKLSWENVNFYDNGFSKDFAMSIINNDFTNKNISINIPDITTDGYLKKMWISLNREIILIKGGNVDKQIPDKNLLSANEIIATEIANILNIDHVQYFPIRINDKYYCACKSYIDSPNEEAVSLLQMQHTNSKYNKFGIEQLYHQLGCINHFVNYMFLDALIANFDRHEKNINFVHNINTPYVFKPLPVFDSGSSLAFYKNEQLKPLNLNIREQFEYLSNMDKNQINNLNEKINISSIKEIIKRNYDLFNIPSNYIKDAIEIVLQNYNICNQIIKENTINKHRTEDYYER